MRISGFGETDAGLERAGNEDAILVRDDLGLYAVCDGMGGRRAGEIASRTAVEVIESFFDSRAEELRDLDSESPDGRRQLVTWAREAIERASEEVYRVATSDAGRAGMGTTATVVLLHGARGAMAHVGDTRLYLLRDGRLSQLSEDHGFVAALVAAGLVRPEEARHHPFRGKLTRAVGLQTSVEVDTLAFDLVPGDCYLLCSDGLHGYFDDEPEGLKALLTADGADLASIPGRLIAAANERGGKDNISALVLAASTGVRTEAADDAHGTEVALRFETLREITLFRGLSMKELVQVIDVLELRHYARDETVVHEGEDVGGLYAILEGDVRVTRGTSELAVLGAGGHFGEMSLLHERPRSATVTALGPTRLLAMEPRAFRELVVKHPELGARILWSMAKVLSDRLESADVILGKVK